MTNEQKERITAMRQDGIGYKRIAKAIELPLSTVQSFCRRANVTASETAVYDEYHCRQCGKVLIQANNAKRRKFCSEECRVKWWTLHPCSKNGNTKSNRTAICTNCGRPFTAYGKGIRKYCSHACYVEARFGGGER